MVRVGVRIVLIGWVILWETLLGVRAARSTLLAHLLVGIVFRVRGVVEHHHAAVVGFRGLTGRAQPQSATEMARLVVVCRGVGHIAGGVLLGIDRTTQAVGPVIGERALLEHRLAVPRHEDRTAVLHGIVTVERATVDDHDTVIVGAAVTEVDRAATGCVIVVPLTIGLVSITVMVLLPVASERAAVDGQPAAGPDRAATGRILVPGVRVYGVTVVITRHVMLRVAHIVRECAVVDGQRAVAPDRAATMKAEVLGAVRLSVVPLECAAVDGDVAIGMDDRAAGALYRLASGRCHGIGNGRSLIVHERATVDRKITLRIDVGDVAVACGV